MAFASSSSAGAAIIDGRAIAAELTGAVARETQRLKAETGIVPGLAVVLVGEDPASQIYVAGKGKTARALGFNSVQRTLKSATTQQELLAEIENLNRMPSIHGILVQLPLPPHLGKEAVIEAISPAKDVDGLHPINAGRLSNGDPAAVVPCTPAGCLILARGAAGSSLCGRSAVVVGRSNLVGKPMAQLLLGENCTVTLAHSRTADLATVVRGADIVVAAVGRAQLIRGAWIKPGAIVIDVGMNSAGSVAGGNRQGAAGGRRGLR